MALSSDQLDPRNNLQLYSREAVRNSSEWTDRMVRQEYSRLRDIAQKRLQRLAKAEPESYAYRTNVGQYAPARGQSTAELREQLPRLARFIAAKTGTVSGIRAQRMKAIATLRSHGYDFINEKNYKQFADFMDEWRSRKLGKAVYAQLMDAFEFSQEHDINLNVIKAHYEDYVTEQETVRNYTRMVNESGREVSATAINRMLTAYDKARASGKAVDRDKFLRDYRAREIEKSKGKQKRRKK